MNVSSYSFSVLIRSPENAIIVSGGSPNVSIATLRLKEQNDSRKICRYAAVALPSGLRGVPAWSEQDALESLHKVLAEKAGEIITQRGCKIMLLHCTALSSTNSDSSSSWIGGLRGACWR